MNAQQPTSVVAKPASIKGKPLRICLLGYRSQPYGGGQGIYLRYLSKALLEAGHHVDVISGEPYPHLVEGVGLIKMPGLNLYENGLLSLRPKHLLSFANIVEWMSKLTGGFAEPYAFGRRVVAYLAKHGHNYDLIHDNQSLCFGLLRLQDKGVPVVVTIHHPITRDLQIALNASNKWWEKILIRRWHSFLQMQVKVAQKLKHVTTVSERSRVDIAQAFSIDPDNIELIYNGIDTEVFAPRPEVIREPRLMIATASADQPLKGLNFLLEAFASLRQDYKDLRLLVVGQPKAGGATEALIKKLGLGDELQFVHGISTSDLVDHYARATLAVVPSVYEGFGLPAGEAMACQVPLVSSDGGALPEVVGDAGLVVKASDSQVLAGAVARLLENNELRDELGVQGRQRILQLFSWKVAAQQMSAYYQQVLAGSK